MNRLEIFHILIAIIILGIVIGFESILQLDSAGMGYALLFALVIIVVNIGAKKVVAGWLDSDVEHRIWHWYRYALKPGWHFEKAVPIGAILPLFITAFSVGFLKVMTVLTYDTKALKRRAAKRHGFYSFTEMTDWHTSLIGGAGIVAILALSFITYWFAGLENLARMAAFYAFYNMIPISKLDGTQIYMGSRILWWTLAIITLVFASYAFLLI